MLYCVKRGYLLGSAKLNSFVQYRKRTDILLINQPCYFPNNDNNDNNGDNDDDHNYNDNGDTTVTNDNDNKGDNSDNYIKKNNNHDNDDNDNIDDKIMIIIIMMMMMVIMMIILLVIIIMIVIQLPGLGMQLQQFQCDLWLTSYIIFNTCLKSSDALHSRLNACLLECPVMYRIEVTGRDWGKNYCSGDIWFL